MLVCYSLLLSYMKAGVVLNLPCISDAPTCTLQKENVYAMFLAMPCDFLYSAAPFQCCDVERYDFEIYLLVLCACYVVRHCCVMQLVCVSMKIIY